jgi:hypothetical protein
VNTILFHQSNTVRGSGKGPTVCFPEHGYDTWNTRNVWNLLTESATISSSVHRFGCLFNRFIERLIGWVSDLLIRCLVDISDSRDGRLEIGGCKHLWNVGKFPLNTARHPRRHSSVVYLFLGRLVNLLASGWLADWLIDWTILSVIRSAKIRRRTTFTRAPWNPVRTRDQSYNPASRNSCRSGNSAQVVSPSVLNWSQKK